MRGVEQIPWLYDLGLALAERGGFGRWRRWLAEGARGRTLDLGTGTGRNLPWLPAGARAVAVDPSAENLARARRRAAVTAARTSGAAGATHVCGFVRARAEALPFKDGAFDTVLSGLVLCSVDDPAAALGELGRVLAPGGEVRALEHVRASGWRGRLQDVLQPAWTRFTGGCRPNRDTERAVEAAGLPVDSATRRARGVMRRFVSRRG